MNLQETLGMGMRENVDKQLLQKALSRFMRVGVDVKLLETSYKNAVFKRDMAVWTDSARLAKAFYLRHEYIRRAIQSIADSVGAGMIEREIVKDEAGQPSDFIFLVNMDCIIQLQEALSASRVYPYVLSELISEQSKEVASPGYLESRPGHLEEILKIMDGLKQDRNAIV